MHNEKENNNIESAKNKLIENLSYFMDIANAFEASDGLLSLLCDMRDEQLTKRQLKALYSTLQVLNSISALQIAETSCGQQVMHKLKIA
jgi:hypothetical protein